ncbi:hypothetical protein DFH29DRAFT_793805, partial [Suillus ampliporus]
RPPFSPLPVLLLISLQREFSVTVGTPTQCDDLAVSWTGGQAPFEIVLTPTFDMFQSILVPESAFSNGKGSYSIPQLSLASGTTFLLTMSDATAFGSGGTTTILTVGPPIAKNNCNTTLSSPPYTFELSPEPLQQRSQFTVLADSAAVLPVAIVGLIPGGQSLIFNSTNYSFTSVLDVSAGSQLVFFMIDSMGIQGGVSELKQVSGSTDSSCLNANSPSSTASGSSPTASPTSSPSPSSSSNVALIAGTASGGGVVLAALIIFGVFLLCRRRASRSPDVMPFSNSQPRRLRRTDLKSEVSDHGQLPPQIPSPYKTDPLNSVSYLASPIQSGSKSTLTNASGSNFAVSNPPIPFNQTQNTRSPNIDNLAMRRDTGSQSMTPADGRTTAGQTAYQPRAPTRVIVHTDVEDVVPDDNGVVELPPQYSERRRVLALQSESAPRPTSSHP